MSFKRVAFIASIAALAPVAALAAHGKAGLWSSTTTAVMAGMPARRLRQRFASEVSERIEALAWWDWPVAKLADAIPDMQALSIEDFLERWSGR